MILTRTDVYKLTFLLQGNQLTYTAKIKAQDDNSITFKDKFAQTKTYNIKYFISADVCTEEEKERYYRNLPEDDEDRKEYYNGSDSQ